ncbi:MAG TPA: Ig-like domain-containing protein, partial [Acidimicrobiia bacterium]|nr:Ig-like domain-containing protein [Acidimicrobiia bacterium]
MLVVSAAPASAAFTSCGATSNTCQVAATDDTYTAVFNKKLVVAAPGVLNNDSGPDSTRVDIPDSDTQSVGGATITWTPVAGNPNLGTGAFTYTPDPASPWSGVDTFDYWIQNAAGDSTDFNTVTINIPATVANDSYTVLVNHHLTVAAPGVLKNDVGIDPSSTIFDIQSAQNGTVNDDVNGAFDYIPPQNFKGTDI